METFKTDKITLLDEKTLSSFILPTFGDLRKRGTSYRAGVGIHFMGAVWIGQK